MAGTTYDSTPTPSRAFPALKTPLPEVVDGPVTGVHDRLDRLISRARVNERRTASLNALADACLAEIADLRGL